MVTGFSTKCSELTLHSLCCDMTQTETAAFLLSSLCEPAKSWLLVVTECFLSFTLLWTVPLLFPFSVFAADFKLIVEQLYRWTHAHRSCVSDSSSCPFVLLQLCKFYIFLVGIIIIIIIFYDFFHNTHVTEKFPLIALSHPALHLV